MYLCMYSLSEGSNAHRVVVKRNTSTEDTCNNIQRKNAESTESWIHKINGLYKQALEQLIGI